jgi:hypothetical protein
LSWDLIWLFAALGIVVIAIHMLYRMFFAPPDR